MRKALEDFRTRCPGVLGSWIVGSNNGAIIHQELPSFIDVDLSQVTSQLQDIYLALDPGESRPTMRRPNGDGTYDITLKFDSFNLLSRSFSRGLLVIIAEQDANLVRVRALSNLVLKKLGRQETTRSHRSQNAEKTHRML